MKSFAKWIEERFLFSDTMTVNTMVQAISEYLEEMKVDLLCAAGLHIEQAKTAVRTGGEKLEGAARLPYVRIEYRDESGVIVSRIVVLDGPAFGYSKRYPAFTNLANACREAGNALHHAVYDASRTPPRT